MEYVGVVVILALGQYFGFAFAVAKLREQRKIPATEASGDPELIRAVRAHANTGEMLIVFIPLVLLCGYFLDGRLAAAVGAVWIPARAWYRRGYLRDVRGRIPGFVLGDVVMALLALGALVGIGRRLLSA